MVSGQIGPWSDTTVASQSTMVGNEKPWYDGQTVAGVRQTEILSLVDSWLAVHRVPSRALK